MFFSQRLLPVVMTFAIALVLLVTTPAIASPNNLLPAQAPEQPAILTGPKANAPIPIYLRPAANQPNVGYGTNGASVSITERAVGYFLDEDSSTIWNHIRLDAPPFTEGWVQGKFLTLPTSDMPNEK